MEPGGRARWSAFLVLVLTALVAACEREDPPPVDTNTPPQTFITRGPKLSNNPLDPVNQFYRAHLFWRGEDADGQVVGFRVAVDDTFEAANWTFTTATDSVFRFQVAEIGPLEHLFLIRAVDNLGKQDPTPDTLRFEAFTSAAPTVELVRIVADMPTLGRRILERAEVDSIIASGNRVTVEYNPHLGPSVVTWVWTGEDEDGEVVRWTSQLDSEDPVQHARNDTMRTISGLEPGAHTLTVIATDDAGAVSRDPGRYRLFSNFDPVTTIDRSSVVAKLARPWVGPGDTLTVDDIVGDPQAPPDTIPLGSRISMCWSSTDIDGPVVRYQYFFTAQVQGQVPDMGGSGCASPTDPLGLSSVLGSPGGVFLVRGIDTHGAVESRPDTLRLFINKRPTVRWLDEGIVTVPTGQLQRFEFDGDDVDSDPALLSFNWNIDNRPPSIETIPLPPGQRFADYFFEVQDLGRREIVIRSFDPSGSDLPSEPATLSVQVVTPSARGAP